MTDSEGVVGFKVQDPIHPLSYLCSELSLNILPHTLAVTKLTSDDNDVTLFFQNLSEAFKEFKSRQLSSLTELENYKAESLIRESNFEQQLHSSESRSRLLSKELATQKQILDGFRQEQSRTSTTIIEKEKSIKDLQHEVTTLKEQMAILQQEKIKLENARKESLLLLASREEELSRQQDGFNELEQKYAEATISLTKSNSELSERKSAEVVAKFQEQKKEQEILLIQQQNEWLTSELKRVTDQISVERNEKSTELNTLRNELDVTLMNSKSYKSKFEHLKQRNAEQISKIEELMEKVKTLTEMNTVNEEQFKQEMATQKKLVELYKVNSNDNSGRIAELEETIDAIREELHEKEKEIDESQEREAGLIAQYEKTLEDRELEIEKLNVELNTVNELLTKLNEEQSDKKNHISILSPAALATSKMQKSGMTFTQVYAEYTKQQEELRNEKFENSRLQECLTQIMHDIEERAPILHQQRVDYEKMSIELETMSNHIFSLTEEKNNAEDRLSQVAQSLKEKELLLASASKEIEDLTKQVRTLLAQLHNVEIEDNSLPSSLSLLGGILEGGNGHNEEVDLLDLTDADTLISEQLVTFKNIEDLQHQNQRLLRTVRQLTQQLELLERLKIEENQKSNLTLNEIHQQEIANLQNTIKDLQAKIESYIRERDMCRRMLERKDVEKNSLSQEMMLSQSTSSVNYEKLYHELQENFDVYRKESSVDSKMLKESLEVFQKENSEYRVQIAKANSQIDFLNERYKLLVENTNIYSREVEELRERCTGLLNTIGKQDSVIQKTSEDLVQVKAVAEQLRNENSSLGTEIKMLKASEERLVKENSHLTIEREKLSYLSLNLQTIHSDFEKTETETKRKLLSKIEDQEKSIENLTTKLNEESKFSRSISLTKDNELKESQEKVIHLMNELQQVRIELATSHSAVIHAEKEIEVLKQGVVEATNKLQLYEKNSLLLSENSDLSTEERLKLELTQTHNEVVRLKEELASMAKHVDQFKAISSASEEALSQLNSTYDEYKISTDEQLSKNKETIDTLNRSVEELNCLIKEKSRITFELEQKVELLSIEISAKSSIIKDLEEQIVNIRGEANILENNLQESIKHQSKLAKDAQANYEREITLHAEALKSITKLKENERELNAKLLSIMAEKDTTEKKLESASISWDNQKGMFEKSMLEIQQRCDDLTRQNNLLHSQLEEITSQAAKIRDTSDQSLSTFDTQTVSMKSLDELREVVKFLRREKEILSCQQELFKQERDRLKQQLEHTNRSLDEARALLSEERRKVQETKPSIAQESEFLEKVNEMTILRESNNTLREEFKKYEKKAIEMEDKFKAASKDVESLNEKMLQLSAELSCKDKEINSLQEDNDKWKNRTQQILQKYERIDPVEYEQLKQNLEKVEAEKNEAITNLQNLIAKHNSQIENNQKRIAKLAEMCQIWKKKHDAVVEKQNTMATSKIQEQELDLEEAKKKSEDQQKEIEVMKEENAKYKKEEAARYEKLRNKALMLYTKIQGLESDKAMLLKNKEIEMQKLNEEFEQKRGEDLESKEKEVEMRMKLILSMKDIEIKKLREQIESLSGVVNPSPATYMAASAKRLRDEASDEEDPAGKETALEDGNSINEPHVKKAKMEEDSSVISMNDHTSEAKLDVIDTTDASIKESEGAKGDEETPPTITDVDSSNPTMSIIENELHEDHSETLEIQNEESGQEPIEESYQEEFLDTQDVAQENEHEENEEYPAEVGEMEEFIETQGDQDPEVVEEGELEESEGVLEDVVGESEIQVESENVTVPNQELELEEELGAGGETTEETMDPSNEPIQHDERTKEEQDQEPKSFIRPGITRITFDMPAATTPTITNIQSAGTKDPYPLRSRKFINKAEETMPTGPSPILAEESTGATSIIPLAPLPPMMTPSIRGRGAGVRGAITATLRGTPLNRGRQPARGAPRRGVHRGKIWARGGLSRGPSQPHP